LDALKTYYDEWKKQGVEVVAITIDDSQQINKVKPMIQQKGWKYTILSDVNKLSQNKLGYSAIPMTYIVNKSGDIVYSHNGYTPGDENELAEKVKELLK
jgi:peroxiredoxin